MRLTHRLGAVRVLVAIISIGSHVAVARAADAHSPHPHQGVLQPYAGPPPIVALTEQEHEKLESGAAIYKQLEIAGGNRAVAVFRVNAPPEVVWSIIVDFQSYPQWIDDLVETEIYRREDDDIFVRFHVEHWLVGSYIYYIHHTYPYRTTGWGTWKLDYTRKSDLDDSVGFWQVTPANDDRTTSNVTYSTDIRLAGLLSGLLRSSVVKTGLRQATSWVKIQSEARSNLE